MEGQRGWRGRPKLCQWNIQKLTENKTFLGFSPGLIASGFISLPWRKKKEKRGGSGGWWTQHICFQWSPLKHRQAVGSRSPEVGLLLPPEPTPACQEGVQEPEWSWVSHFTLCPSFCLPEWLVRFSREVIGENMLKGIITLALTFSRSFPVLYVHFLI